MRWFQTDAFEIECVDNFTKATISYEQDGYVLRIEEHGALLAHWFPSMSQAKAHAQFDIEANLELIEYLDMFERDVNKAEYNEDR